MPLCILSTVLGRHLSSGLARVQRSPGSLSASRILRTLCGSLALVLMLPYASFAAPKKDAIEVDPLLPFKAQMEIVRRECANKPHDRVCEQKRKKVRDEYVKLKEYCKTHPYDEKCGSIMKDDKTPGYKLELFCASNPQNMRCVARRESMKRKGRLLRLFCNKNPDAKRCQSRAVKRKGAGSFFEWCQTHADSKRCISYMEKINRNKQPPEAQENVF